ncbi:MAG: BamA/TamA family outer membrane protein [bacterium]
MKAFWLAVLLFVLPLHIAAQDIPTREVWRVETIEIQGLDRTERRVVTRELLFKDGGLVTKSQLTESIQRLKNMGLFRTAEYTLIPADPSGVNVRVVISVDERWTILPFFNVSFGGDLFSLLAGIYDVNLFGKYLEAGFRYQRLGDTNSFVLWFYDPRFLDERLFFGGQFWWANRLRYLFNDKGEVEGGYLRERRLVNIIANKEVSNRLRYGGGISLQHDGFSLDLVDDDTAALQRAQGLPADQQHGIANVNVTLGRIDEDSYFREGLEFSQGLSVSHELWGSSESYVEVGSQLLAFARLPWKQNIGARVGLGFTSAEHIENQFFLGGLDTVRGFYDSRFRGPMYWYMNTEYRVPSLDYRWLVLQHIVFLDAVGVSSRASQLWQPDGISAGIGLRILSPKIYRFGARIDYALPLKGTGTTPLSFGVQQFF